MSNPCPNCNDDGLACHACKPQPVIEMSIWEPGYRRELERQLAERIAAALQHHKPTADGRLCVTCGAVGGRWPCDTARELTGIDLQARVDASPAVQSALAQAKRPGRKRDVD